MYSKLSCIFFLTICSWIYAQEQNESSLETVFQQIEEAQTSLKKTNILLEKAKQALKKQQEENKLLREENRLLKAFLAYLKKNYKDNPTELSENPITPGRSIKNYENDSFISLPGATKEKTLTFGDLTSGPGTVIGKGKVTGEIDYGFTSKTEQPPPKEETSDSEDIDVYCPAAYRSVDEIVEHNLSNFDYMYLPDGEIIHCRLKNDEIYGLKLLETLPIDADHRIFISTDDASREKSFLHCVYFHYKLGEDLTPAIIVVVVAEDYIDGTPKDKTAVLKVFSKPKVKEVKFKGKVMCFPLFKGEGKTWNIDIKDGKIVENEKTMSEIKAYLSDINKK